MRPKHRSNCTSLRAQKTMGSSLDLEERERKREVAFFSCSASEDFKGPYCSFMTLQSENMPVSEFCFQTSWEALIQTAPRPERPPPKYDRQVPNWINDRSLIKLMERQADRFWMNSFLLISFVGFLLSKAAFGFISLVIRILCRKTISRQTLSLFTASLACFCHSVTN